MKKYLIIFICFIFLVASCKKTEDHDDISLSVDDSSLQDLYYTDEFNISSINLIYTKNGESTVVVVLPDMVSGLKDSYEEGSHEFDITYGGKSVNIVVNMVKKEYYTEGLIFAKTANNTYRVIGYEGTEENVTIPSEYRFQKVTEIKALSFKENKLIKKVLLPNTIIEIGKEAFARCESLEKINIPTSVRKIGEGAFYECAKLRTLVIPNNTIVVGEYAFNKCRTLALEAKEIPSSWSEGAFDSNNCYVYKNIILDNVKEVDNFLCYIESDGVTILNYYGNETIVNIPNEIEKVNVTKIGPYSFYQSNITKISFCDTIETIGAHAFQECNGISIVTLPKNLKYLESYSFASCESLERVDYNEGLLSIGAASFSANHSLKEVILPSTLTEIGAHAFQNSYYIEKIYIPISVVSVGDGAVYACSKAKVYIQSATIPSTWSSNWNPSVKSSNIFLDCGDSYK